MAKQTRKDWTPKVSAHAKRVAEQWDTTPWREPDSVDDDGLHMIWYGADGVEGDVATEIQFDEGRNLFIVTEYTGVAGLVDNPPAPILQTRTGFYVADFREGMAAAGVSARRITNRELSMKDILRLAVGYGVAKLSLDGGDESWAEVLPL